MEGTTGLKFQLHQRRRSFTAFFKAREKIQTFMMLQLRMKRENQAKVRTVHIHLRAALLAKPGSALQNQPRRCNITIISVLDLKFLVFSHIFFIHQMLRAKYFPPTIAQITNR